MKHSEMATRAALCCCLGLFCELGCGKADDAGADIEELNLFTQSVEGKIQQCEKWDGKIQDSLKDIRANFDYEAGTFTTACESAIGTAGRSFTREIKNSYCKQFETKARGNNNDHHFFLEDCKNIARGGQCIVSQQFATTCNNRMGGDSEKQCTASSNPRCLYKPPVNSSRCQPTQRFPGNTVCQPLLDVTEGLSKKQINCDSIFFQKDGQLKKLCKFELETCAMASNNLASICDLRSMETGCQSLVIKIQEPLEVSPLLKNAVTSELQKQQADVRRAVLRSIAQTIRFIDSNKLEEASVYFQKEVLGRFYPKNHTFSPYRIGPYLMGQAKTAAAATVKGFLFSKLNDVEAYCSVDNGRCIAVVVSQKEIDKVKDEPWLVPVWTKDINSYGNTWRLDPLKSTNHVKEDLPLCEWIPGGSAQCTPDTSFCGQVNTEAACRGRTMCQWRPL